MPGEEQGYKSFSGKGSEKMKKIRLVWILAGVVAVALILLIAFWPNAEDLSVGKAKVEQLPEGQVILCNAWPEAKSVQKGDAFMYTIQVLYDTSEISGVDRDSLDSAVNLEPFEVRNTYETEFNVASGARVYQRQYEIQLITGEATKTYEFPSVVIRYKLKGSEGYAETNVVPESVYVAPRIPASDVNSIAAEIKAGNSLFRPLDGTVEDANQNRLPWILVVLGCVLAAVMAADVTLRVIPQWREKARQAKMTEMSEILHQAYRSLLNNVAAGASPKAILHQIDHIVRLVLAPKEKIGWLEEPAIDTVPEEIRPSVVSLFEKSQRAESADVKQAEVEEALKQLEDVFGFYYAGEAEAWKV
jgi:hypothetical protein